jgi:cell division protein FtsI (penicillin-binding protein 3)
MSERPTRPRPSRPARDAARRVADPRGWLPATRKDSAEAEQRQLAEGRIRADWVGRGLLTLFAALAGRAGWVMLVPDPNLEMLAQRQFEVPEEHHGDRGDITDRHGRVLATTVRLPTLYADPLNMPDEQAARWIPEIAALIGKDATTVRTKFDRAKAAARANPGTRSARVRLAQALEPTATQAFMQRHKDAVDAYWKARKTVPDYHWLWTEDEALRVYPARELASPLVGFLDASEAGASGLERVLDHELRGETFRKIVQQDRHGRNIGGGASEDQLARDGHTVQLTIDAAIQHATEQALAHAVTASAPKAAMAVVSDVRTGAILAMANWPAGNPNDSNDRAAPEQFKNHAAMDQIEPGSVIKPFVVAAALQEKLTTPDEPIDCHLGRYAIGPNTIKDDHEKGVIPVSDVIKYSSNIGTALIAMRLGPARVIRYLNDFGFARTTGLGLPGEVAGTLRGENMRPIELATTAFGQGMTASGVQLAAAMSTLANGGLRMQPYLVDAVIESGVPTRRPPRQDRQVVSEEVARQIALMLEGVVQDGTGTQAAVKGYRAGGKTGTAQKAGPGGYTAERVSSFVGFLPIERPEITIAVSVDSPTIGSKYGGVVSGPVFAEIGAFAMNYLGVPPESGTTPPTTTPPTAPTGTADAPEPAPRDPVTVRAGDSVWRMPDLAGRSMRDALGALASTGASVDVTGTGRVAEQSPEPGAAIGPGTTIRLTFR